MCGKSCLSHCNCHFSIHFPCRTTQFDLSCGNCHLTHEHTIMQQHMLGVFVLLGLLASNHLGCRAYHVRSPVAASWAPSISGVHHSNSRLLMMMGGSDNAAPIPSMPVVLRKALASGIVALSTGLSLQLLPPLTTAAYAVTSGDDAAVAVPAAAAATVIEKVPLLTKRTSDLQQYADIARGFKLLRSGLLCYASNRRALITIKQLHFSQQRCIDKYLSLLSVTDHHLYLSVDRPFGFNEFDGAGGGYAVKFASLFEGESSRQPLKP